MIRSCDIAVIGSGFAGSLFAMAASRLGRSVLLLDRVRHPRFAIGESSTPLANLLLEELALRYDLPRLLPLTAWGAWQKAYPEISCGLKRGFSFYHHHLGQPWHCDPDRRNQLLVAASPNDHVADTHWFRADLDHFLVREAEASGVEFLDELDLNSATPLHDNLVLTGVRHGRDIAVRAQWVVDASGPSGFLHKALSLPNAPFKYLPRTEGLYAHFRNVDAWQAVAHPGENPPYPVDAAAVHHLFDGGWLWVLRMNNGITSAGIAATRSAAQQFNFAEGEPAWRRLLDQLPSLRTQFPRAEVASPFIHAPQLSFRSDRLSGPRWVLLPSAAGFIDPLLSTGFPLALNGIHRLLAALQQDWNSPRFATALDLYSAQTRAELETVELVVAALYRHMHDFDLFAAVSLLYFAAASFTETVRRLRRPELAGTLFLMSDHPWFGPRLRKICLRALQFSAPEERQELIDDIRAAIEPFDIGGFNSIDRRHWFPVETSDLFHARHKLGASELEIETLLASEACRKPFCHGKRLHKDPRRQIAR